MRSGDGNGRRGCTGIRATHRREMANAGRILGERNWRRGGRNIMGLLVLRVDVGWLSVW